MSNFTILNNEQLEKLIEPFAPGMTPHITPIKYEAVTPDAFLLLFRTTDPRNNEHFFVSYESDSLLSVCSARCTIEDWHGEVLQFVTNDGAEINDDSDITTISTPTHGPYRSLLAKVTKPLGKGYWSSSVSIMPGDNIGEKIKDYTPKQQENARKTLQKILQHKVDAQMPFAESLIAKKKDIIVDDRNMTNMAVKLFVTKDDSIECFYNYVEPSVGGRPSDTKPKADD